MESVIKWQTGEPKEEGEYLVQLKYYNRLIISSWEKFPTAGIGRCFLNQI